MDQCLIEYWKKIVQAVDGRYQAPLPWKSNKCKLRSNQEMALRLTSLLKRLRKNPSLLTAYHELCLSEFIDQGIIEEAYPF